MKNVFCLRNRLISTYGDPFLHKYDAEDVKKEFYKACVLDKEKSKAAFYHESELYFLGTFDDETASFSLLDKPEFIVDLSTFFPKEN